MANVVIEDQNPMMHRAKIRLGIALALLTIALVSLIVAGKSKGSRPVAPSPQVLNPVVPAVLPNKSELPIEVPAQEVKPPLPPTYEALPTFQSFTAEPTPEPPPATAEASPEPSPQKARPKETVSHIETATSGDYVLQVGVFSDMKNAEKQRDNLAKHDIESRLESKLRLGAFSSATELEAAKEKLASAGLEATFSEESSSRGLMLRTGNFSDISSAQHLKSSLDELGFTARSETRVLVGPFANKNTADAARSKIKALGMAVALMPNR